MTMTSLRRQLVGTVLFSMACLVGKWLLVSGQQYEAQQPQYAQQQYQQQQQVHQQPQYQQQPPQQEPQQPPQQEPQHPPYQQQTAQQPQAPQYQQQHQPPPQQQQQPPPQPQQAPPPQPPQRYQQPAAQQAQPSFQQPSPEQPQPPVYAQQPQQQQQESIGRPIGPVDDSDLPDDEWRRVHQDRHIFGDDSGDSFDDTDEHIFDEWDENMDDFVPDMLVNLDIAPRKDEYFYQDVGAAKELIRGGYFVAGSGDIEFTVTDPKGEIFMRKSQPESLFYFESERSGTYTFILSNNKWMEHKQVTFAIGVGNFTSPLSSDNVNDAVAHSTHIYRMLKDLQSESQFLWQRQRAHMKIVNSNVSKVFWFAVLELCFLVFIWSSQVYFIRTLVADRRIF